jgi:hypothetical protein
VVSVVFEREVREPYMENGKRRFHVTYQGAEFVFPNEYSKMLRPIFSAEYDFDAKEENGVITVTFTPDPQKAEDKQMPPKSKMQTSGG